MRGTVIFRMGVAIAVAALWAALPAPAFAGAQVEEKLAQSVVSGLQRAIADNPVPTDYANRSDVRPWIDEMSRRLTSRLPDALSRNDFVATVFYEATRAGLDPQLVLGVIQYESNFRK